MRRSLLFCMVCALLLVKNASASNIETVTWTGVPIEIEIPVGVERVIKFSHPKIQIAVPMALAGIATAESNRGVVYLRASRAFNKSRFRFREKDTGKIYAVDVTASNDSGKLAPIVIVSDDEAVVSADIAADEISLQPDQPMSIDSEVDALEVNPINDSTRHNAAQSQTPRSTPKQHGYATLIRFAMQQVYAPERLIEALSDTHRVAFNTELDEINIVPGAKVNARVLGQWRNADHYITAIYLQNMSANKITLDPRQLSGRHTWKSTALMNGVLTPANTFGDATTLVAISDRKWLEAVQWLR